ncbi:uncharacterized protein LOC135210398 [Macrobrachium nipponense]|uniref:uncharacterized protein LOC135210398 n=1 Tax=Macrobrachium nipponense TaxID=159736 RepID=UPI0030C87C9F
MLVALGKYISDILMEIAEGIYEDGEPATQMYKSTYRPYKDTGTDRFRWERSKIDKEFILETRGISESRKRGIRDSAYQERCKTGLCVSDLFNLYREMIMRDLRNIEGIKVGGVTVNNIRYADDTALVADSHDKLQALISTLHQSSRERALSINIKKTEVMIINMDEIPPRIDIKIDAETLKQIHIYNYLGCTVGSDGKFEKEIKKRISMAKDAFGKIKKLVTNSKISMNLRRRFVECFVWSVLLYGCETLTLRKAEEERLQAAEMWFWRRMLKISWTERKTSEEVLERVGVEREL